MASLAKTAFNPMSVATNACLISSSSLLAPSKISYSYTCKTTKFQLYCKSLSSLSTCLSSPKKKCALFRVCVVAAQGEVEEDEQEIQGKLDWDASEVEEEVDGTEGGYVEPPEGAKVYVGNLPYDVTNEALAELFEQAGVVEIAEIVYDRMTGQSRGFGFVTMSTVEEAERAVELYQRHNMGGRFLTVNIAAPKGSQPERPPREAGNRIYVGNISWNADESQLEQMFSQYGTVVSARIVYDKESGRSRGFGFVEMSSTSEMNDAIANLDGEDMDGRAIRVNAAEERTRRGRF